MATNAAPPAGVPPRKKTSPWVWVIVGVLGFFLLAGLAVSVAAYYFYGKVRQYAETAEKNPAYAAAKLLAAVNPDLEVVSSDDRKGLVTIREKKTGKTVTLNLEDIQQGRITFEEEGKGTVTIGSNAEVPAWFPKYPGSTVTGGLTGRTQESEGGGFSFTCRDSMETVTKFYESELKKAGMEVQTAGGMLSAEGGKRKVILNLTTAEGATAVTVSFEAAK